MKLLHSQRDQMTQHHYVDLSLKYNLPKMVFSSLTVVKTEPKELNLLLFEVAYCLFVVLTDITSCLVFIIASQTTTAWSFALAQLVNVCVCVCVKVLVSEKMRKRNIYSFLL